MRKSCGNCRHRHSLASRVHQNSPRTRLLASNHMTLHQRRCAALFQPKGRKLTDPVRAPAWPQRKNFGHSLEVCYWPNGRSLNHSPVRCWHRCVILTVHVQEE